MGIELWGPALDAEVAYRRERLVADARRTADARRARAGQGAADAPAARRVGGRPPGRRWSLRGSGAWYAAR
ncbi:hypothetical protein [Cellulomonas iranensis]|uniref:Uncharacterized protein n=1 Tax=Cellulomonas iranensis TaxID=76862 RepID=A0ABU0GHG6_9CELL|nr:hypothetical protein [Cellulomonas iranensis]MDQ0424803.1 hypothetical protein [Cellulomonas iranensis]UCN14265.1 hypothetical protein LFM56_15515 [Cellulomonas iranensis]